MKHNRTLTGGKCPGTVIILYVIHSKMQNSSHFFIFNIELQFTINSIVYCYCLLLSRWQSWLTCQCQCRHQFCCNNSYCKHFYWLIYIVGISHVECNFYLNIIQSPFKNERKRTIHWFGIEPKKLLRMQTVMEQKRWVYIIWMKQVSYNMVYET